MPPLYAAPVMSMFDLLAGQDELAAREPPREFRIFAAGVNQTEKGPFTFDETAQQSVMDAYARRGIDLTMDYEHQALHDPPMEAPNSCKSWVPQIRNGELWATECKWTDRAYGYLASGEYRYFSPAFSHDDDGRIKEVLNVALTNMPAMRGIAPLVAASRLHGNGKETAMDWEAKCKELQTQLEGLTAKLTAMEATNAELTAKLSSKDDVQAAAATDEVKGLTAVLSLGATAGAQDRTAAVTSLTTFRSNVRSITGADSDPVAIGKIHAWKAAHEEVTRLSSRVTELENEKIAGEFEAVLNEASAKGLAPVKRTELKAEAMKLNGGRITRDAISFLRTCLSIPMAHAPGGHQQPNVEGGAGLDPLQIHIAKVCGKELPTTSAQGK